MTSAPSLSPKIMLSQEILRAYDIRGIYGETLSYDVAFAIGRAFATIVARKLSKTHPIIVTARDGRESSPILSEGLIAGLKASGADVKDCGVGPTPMCYFAAYHLNADAGIMLTGSHNPPTHNGFKMVCDGKPFYGDDILALGALIAAGDFLDAPYRSETIEMRDVFTARLLEAFKVGGAKPLTVVWDSGNGAAGEITEMLVAKLHGTHYTLNSEIDGTFPNHHPDPTVPENLAQLIAKVKEVGADVGVAFDGDGDRIGAVDGEGNILWGDQMLVLFAREILSRKAGATIIADVKASQTLFDDVAAHGGNAIMWKTGHSLIKAKMKETKAEIAGEMSGHIFFADGYYGFDDGLYAAVRLLDLLAHSDQTLTQMRASIPAVLNTPEIRVDCSEARKFAIIEEVRARLHAAVKAGEKLEVNEVDGVRVKYLDGWWLARASNTQSALIVRCEAKTQATLDALKGMVKAQLEQSGLEVNLEASSAH
jgi:phosphomannomutase